MGKPLWAIADQLRGAMNADDFRDYMLAFLFRRYLSDSYEGAACRELGSGYPTFPADDSRVPLEIWYANNLNISRYISTAKPEPEIDLAATHQQLQLLHDRVSTAAEKHNGYLKELGLPPLPS